MDEADWREHVAFHADRLEHPDPFVAEVACGEIARAPYAAMRTLAPKLDARRVERWLDDPALARRRGLARRRQPRRGARRRARAARALPA